MPLKRRNFLAYAAAGTAALGAASEAGAQTAAPAGPSLPVLPPNKGRALVLTGGINRGAYQAGMVYGMAQAAGLKDGEPLDYDIITGSSIGALNAYLVATAQYSQLRNVWFQVGARNVLQIKPKYASLVEESSGAMTRLFTGVLLATSMSRNVTGILNPEPIKKLLKDFADPSIPTVIPLAFSATNLTRKRLEIFIRRATSPDGAVRQTRVETALFPRQRIRPHPVSDDILQSALFASAALPILFDPIEIPRSEDPKMIDQYVDGGMTDNVPVFIAGAVARDLQVIEVDPPDPSDDNQHYTSALGVGTRVFNIMQTSIIRYATDLTYALNTLQSENLGQLQAEGFPFSKLPIKIEFKQPIATLPGELGDFNDTAANVAMFDIGVKDAARPWTAITNISQL